MGNSGIESALADLEKIDSEFSVKGARLNLLSKDPRRHVFVLPDGRRLGLLAHTNRRRKTMRDWLRKWGRTLKSSGYFVRNAGDRTWPQFVVEKKEQENDDDLIAQIDEGKIKKTGSRKSERINKLRMRQKKSMDEND